MHFTVNHADLLNAINWVARSLPNRPTTPILAGIKMVVSGNRLTLSVFDYEQSAQATIDVFNAQDGEAIVLGRTLSDIVRSLPKEPVQAVAEGTRLVVRAGKSKFNLAILPSIEYPSLPLLPDAIGSVDPITFAEAVKSVAVAAGRDDSLPVLLALRAEFNPAERTLTLAATDRFRLAFITVPYEPVDLSAEPFSAQIPARTLETWAKSLPHDENFTIGFGGSTDTMMSITAGDQTATSRTLDGDFPKFREIVPTDPNGVVTVDVTDLIAATKRVSIVADMPRCNLTISGETLTVSAKGDSDAREDLAAGNLDNLDMTVALNHNFLTDALTAVGSGEVEFSLTNPKKPAIIRSAGKSNYTHLLMPVRNV